MAAASGNTGGVSMRREDEGDEPRSSLDTGEDLRRRVARELRRLPSSSSGGARERDGGKGGREEGGFGEALVWWNRYLEANKTYPLTTKMCTSGVLSAVGNSIGQKIAIVRGKQKDFNLKKLAAFILFGSCISGPASHLWLKFLNSRKTGLKGQQLVLYKICLDRLVYGPCFNAVQMAFVYKVSGQNVEQVWKSLKANFLQAQTLNLKMWPFAQYFNFNFVPPELQLLYMNFVALVWTILLSTIL